MKLVSALAIYTLGRLTAHRSIQIDRLINRIRYAWMNASPGGGPKRSAMPGLFDANGR